MRTNQRPLLRLSHPSLLRLLTAVLAFLLLGQSSYASEVTYLALQREGQASIAVDTRKKVAYIIDLGRGGDGDQIKLDNLPLLDKLEQSGIEDLFFVCSHPHSDHMGGIMALFKRPRGFFIDELMTKPRFKSITVVDNGVVNNLSTTLKQSLAGNTLIRVNHISAANRNAFAGISGPQDEIQIETIPYQMIEKPNPHGKSVVTFIKLGEHSILDPDDADSAVIGKVVAALKARGVTRIGAFVVPHHGSRYHDIESLLELKPKYAVIAVNPENRFGHPSPPILRRLMETLGKENVVFTGSVENVVLNENGIKHVLYTAANRDSYAMFVAANRIRAEQKGNKEDLRDIDVIKKMMDEEANGGAARRLFEEEVRLNGSILEPDFEFGAISYGSDGAQALQARKIFDSPLSNSENLAGQDVAVLLVRTADPPNARTKLSPYEAQRVLQRLRTLGNNADQARNVHIYFSDATGFRNVLEPALTTNPKELLNLITPPIRAPEKKLPSGGMVFLRGGKLFPVGEATELLGGTLDLCGSKFCVMTTDGSAYLLPFSPGPLFSEVWTRVYDRRIDSFYLSINPTKKFLRDLDSEFGRVPSDRLHFGNGLPGTGRRTHEVVTAGDIENTQIGKILWEADVAFKSASLGFNVLNGDRSVSIDVGAHKLLEQQSDSEESATRIPYRERWCRLYWASGDQSIEVNSASNQIHFKGDAVIARSEAMKMQNGTLIDEPRGRWCGETKNVASALQRQANLPQPQLAILGQLRELAEMQSFVRWATDNGIHPTDQFRQLVGQSGSAPRYEVPIWTSGVKTEPRPRVQLQRYLGKNQLVDYIHVTYAHSLDLESCVWPKWEALSGRIDRDLVYNPITQQRELPNEKYQLVDDWMDNLGKNISVCMRGDWLRMASGTTSEEAGLSSRKSALIGVKTHAQAVQMHGGVLLGVRREFLADAAHRGLLLSPSRKPLFQDENGKLHFWSFTEADSKSGSLGQHVVIDGGSIEAVHALDGTLSFVVKPVPGAISLQEARWSRTGKYAGGVEWAGARHLSDGSWIWEKAAAPCKDSPVRRSDCVQVRGVGIEGLSAEIGDRRREPLLLFASSINPYWQLDLDISSFRVALDQRWKDTPAANLNQRVSLIYEYAKWGFIAEALKKYEEVADKIEGDTVDTILLKLLEGPTEDR
jgi:beta-lactamase superfamily II metal-dependent hydrolase